MCFVVKAFANIFLKEGVSTIYKIYIGIEFGLKPSGRIIKLLTTASKTTLGIYWFIYNQNFMSIIKKSDN